MSSNDDDIFAIYNQDLLALSSKADAPKRLINPKMTAHAVSPICGSEVDIDLNIDTGGKITEIGFAVDACALTKSVVAVLSMAAMGKTRGDIKTAGADLQAMLDGAGDGPSGDFEKLRILLPVKDYKARHNAILLPFEAVEKAFKNKD